MVSLVDVKHWTVIIVVYRIINHCYRIAPACNITTESWFTLVGIDVHLLLFIKKTYLIYLSNAILSIQINHLSCACMTFYLDTNPLLLFTVYGPAWKSAIPISSNRTRCHWSIYFNVHWSRGKSMHVVGLTHVPINRLIIFENILKKGCTGAWVNVPGTTDRQLSSKLPR